MPGRTEGDRIVGPIGPGPRVLILGDSWIHGMGAGRRGFGRLLAKEFAAAEVLDLSKISRTTPDVATGFLDEIKMFRPHVALMNVGGADSLIFPAQRIQDYLNVHAPADWQGDEGLMPRLSYSRERLKRLRQRTEHVVKIIVKQLLINVFGGRRRVTLPELESSARAILAVLLDCDTTVFCFGFGRVDGLSWPKTNASVTATNELLARIADDFPNAVYLDTARWLLRWDDYLADHVHLNRQGHQHIVNGVLASLHSVGPPWSDLRATRPSEAVAEA